MIKEVFPDIFQIKVPLPHNPLGHLNAYLIKSSEKKLLIDTGLNFPEAFEALRHGLSEIGVELQTLTDVLFTHFHIDHIGMIPRIKEASQNLNLWIHHVEKEISRSIVEDFNNYLNSMKSFLGTSDAPAWFANNIQKFHPAFFTPQAYEEIAKIVHSLSDGQEILVGSYCFQVLWTPGHSPGHICLYEPSIEVLISGDHILPTITPHVSQFMADTNPLKDYFKSLKKVEKLNVKVVLPAHEKIFTNLHERVKQLKNHHEQRLKEILFLLKNESLTPYSLASKVHWNVNYKAWNDFPPFQKYLALGETLSHLTFLEEKGLVKRIMFNQKVLYEINKAGDLKLFP
jgi:glyoxylase-like metal-dependent hydrolase (beta-lactamase superfamily II)